ARGDEPRRARERGAPPGAAGVGPRGGAPGRGRRDPGAARRHRGRLRGPLRADDRRRPRGARRRARAAAPAPSGGGAAFGTLGRLATRGIVAALSRTAVAIAALMIAVSAAIGVGIMIASFREAVVSWLEGTLRADVYVSAPSLVGNRPDATLDPALVARLAATPGVARANTSRGVVVPAAGGPVQVVALDVDPARPPRWRFREGDAAAVWRAPDAGSPASGAGPDAAIVSEPYANRRGARTGGRVRLRTDPGDHDFPVAGVSYDYGSRAGVAVRSRRTYDRFWDDRAVSGVAIEAAPGVDLDPLMAELRMRAAGGQDVVVRS